MKLLCKNNQFVDYKGITRTLSNIQIGKFYDLNVDIRNIISYKSEHYHFYLNIENDYYLYNYFYSEAETRKYKLNKIRKPL